MGGMKDWLDNLKKAAAEKRKKANDPVAQKEAKKAEVKKTTARAIKAIDLAKKGADQYGKVAKTVDDATGKVAEKALDIAEKVAPLADKADKAVSAFGQKVKGLFRKAADKAHELKESGDDKPSTGSGILDSLLPAVPETDATKPKAKDAPPQP